MNTIKKKKYRGFWYVDLSKPMCMGDQIKIMFIMLFISCFLFTLVYIFALIRGNGKPDTPSSAEVSQIEMSQPQVSQTESIESVESTVSVAESSVPLSDSLSEEEMDKIFADTTTIELEYDDIYTGDLVLVNKQYQCHSDGENAVSLFELKTDSYIVTDYTVSLNENIVDNVNQMFDDFQSIYGENDLMMACGYRSYANQEMLFENEVEEVGEEEAEKWVARPGYSEHQTGLVFDLNLDNDVASTGIKYDGNDIYKWINDNSYQYGFVLRYLPDKEDITGYEYEPWHFRYVGDAAANYIVQNNLTLEEYIDIVQQHTVSSPLVVNGNDFRKWCVYYIPANADSDTEISVPQNYDYTISGDNFSGFIVTVTIDIKG